MLFLYFYTNGTLRKSLKQPTAADLLDIKKNLVKIIYIEKGVKAYRLTFDEVSRVKMIIRGVNVYLDEILDPLTIVFGE